MSSRPISHCTVAALFALCVASAYGDALTGATTRRGKPDFDPSVCSEQADGKYYIALGRNVLGLPPTGTTITGDLYAGTGFDPIPVPDPAAPEGCFGNPKQLHSYGFLYWVADAVFAKYGVRAETRAQADLLQLFRTIRRNAVPSAADPEWPGEAYQTEFAQLECERATIREELSNGLMACRIKPKPEAHIDRVEDWGASYISHSEIYATPLGKLFVVNCDPGLSTSRVGQCNVAYTVTAGLGVAYRFKPYLGPHPISIDHVLEFDRGLRQQIDNARVPNYPWPDERK